MRVMKILAIEKETPETSDEQFAPFLRQEADRVWDLYKSGVIRELYFRRDREESVLILECRDQVEAANVLKTLPLVANGLISDLNASSVSPAAIAFPIEGLPFVAPLSTSSP